MEFVGDMLYTIIVAIALGGMLAAIYAKYEEVCRRMLKKFVLWLEIVPFLGFFIWWETAAEKKEKRIKSLFRRLRELSESAGAERISPRELSECVTIARILNEEYGFGEVLDQYPAIVRVTARRNCLRQLVDMIEEFVRQHGDGYFHGLMVTLCMQRSGEAEWRDIATLYANEDYVEDKANPDEIPLEVSKQLVDLAETFRLSNHELFWPYTFSLQIVLSDKPKPAAKSKVGGDSAHQNAADDGTGLLLATACVGLVAALASDNTTPDPAPADRDPSAPSSGGCD